jgi:hypothetical protein
MTLLMRQPSIATAAVTLRRSTGVALGDIVGRAFRRVIRISANGQTDAPPILLDHVAARRAPGRLALGRRIQPAGDNLP